MAKTKRSRSLAQRALPHDDAPQDQSPRAPEPPSPHETGRELDAASAIAAVRDAEALIKSVFGADAVTGVQAGFFSVVIIPHTKQHTPGKLADVELHFAGGAFDGLKIVGFAVWAARGLSGHTVSMPALRFATGAERYPLLRPSSPDIPAGGTLRELILQTYFDYERSQRSQKGVR